MNVSYLFVHCDVQTGSVDRIYVPEWQQTSQWQDILVLMLKFHPLCYFHIYVFGMCIAVIYIRSVRFRVRSKKPLPFLMKNGAIIGYTVLLHHLT